MVEWIGTSVNIEPSLYVKATSDGSEEPSVKRKICQYNFRTEQDSEIHSFQKVHDMYTLFFT